jgi:DNA-binding transcriptional ArsR family regulator
MTAIRAQVRLLPTTTGGVDAVAKFFRALGDPTRLRLLQYLLADEHTVTECVHIGLSQGRVSTHLFCLANCGYVQARRTGRNAFYTVADPRVADLVMLAHAFAADNSAALDRANRSHPPRRTDESRPTNIRRPPTPVARSSETNERSIGKFP